MKNFQKILLNIVAETSNIFWVLFKVILPVVVFIRFLELMGAIPYLAKFLDPLTSFIGIDGSLGIVWMAAILVNIYAGMAAFASLQAIFDYSVAETTILGLIALEIPERALHFRLQNRQRANVRRVRLQVRVQLFVWFLIASLSVRVFATVHPKYFR